MAIGISNMLPLNYASVSWLTLRIGQRAMAADAGRIASHRERSTARIVLVGLPIVYTL